MNKKVLIIIVMLLVVLSGLALSHPTDISFSCGGIVCMPEDYDKTQQEKRNTICIGFPKKPKQIFTESSQFGCYGVFINITNLSIKHGY